MIKKITSLFTILWVGLSFSSMAQVLSTESFDATTFVPNGWSLKPVIAPQALWVRNTNSTNPTVTPYLGAGMARFRSRTATAGQKQQLISKALDYSNRGNSAATVSLWMYRDDLNMNYDSVSVYANNTDSLDANAVLLGTIARYRSYMMPDTQAINGWYQYTFNVPASFTNNTTTHLIFEGNCENALGAGQGANITIDEISYDEFPTPCSGTPTVGNLTTSTHVICGGGGTVNLGVTSPLTTNGILYNWQSASSISGPWTNFGNNTASVTSGTLSSKTYFRCVVSCTASGLSYTTNTDSVEISSNPTPLISVSPSTAAVCNGSGTAAMMVATGGVSYVWSPATGLDTTQGNLVMALPSANTQYTVIGTDANGCTASATATVTIANAPTINFTTNPNSTSLCEGTVVVINPIQGGGPGANNNTYLWSDGKTSRRDTVIVTGTMTLTVTVTNQAGCSATDSITLTALPAQNSDFTFTQNNSTINFTDATAGSTAWSWDFGDGNTSANQNPIYTYSQPGTYQVTFIVDGPCKTDTIIKTIQVYPLGTQNLLDQSQFTLYPNPARDLIYMQSAINTIETLQIVNQFGQIVYQNAINAKDAKINIRHLPDGLYTIIVIDDKGTRNRQSFIKQ